MNMQRKACIGPINGKLAHVLIFLMCGTLGSCALMDTRTPVVEKPPPWERMTPGEILSGLTRAQDRFRSLAGGFSITVDPVPPGRPSNLQGVFFVERRFGESRIRVKALGAFGRTLFDLIRDGDRVEIYLPHQKTLYRGNTRETAGQRNPWMEAMSEGFTPFSEARIRPGSSLEIREKEVILPLKDGYLAMERRSGLAQRWHRNNTVVTYEQYLKEESLPAFPTRIRVEKTSEPLQAVCTISQVSVNPDLTGVFDLSGYNPVHIRHLEDLDEEARRGR